MKLLETTAEKTAASVEKSKGQKINLQKRKPQAWEEGPGSQARGNPKKSRHGTSVRIQVGQLLIFASEGSRSWDKKIRNRCVRKYCHGPRIMGM